jgi:hypothetical protein
MLPGSSDVPNSFSTFSQFLIAKLSIFDVRQKESAVVSFCKEL